MGLKAKENALDHRTATQAVEFVYSNLLDVSRIQILFPLIVGYVFWGTVPAWIIVSWCFASCMVYVCRIGLTLQYRKHAAGEKNPWKWGQRFSTTSIVSGLLWGMSAWLFYTPDAQTGLVLLYVLIVGTAAGAVMISSYWLAGYLLYAVPAVSLTALSLFVNGDRNENILGLILCLLVMMLVSVAFKSRDQGYAGIRLRFENLDLIDRLNSEKERAEDANRAKTKFLASANHDLRQPVHALSLLSHAMQSELHTERGKTIYSKLEQTVTNLNQLLESLLDLSQLEANARQVNNSHISLITLGDQLASEIQPLCDEKGLQFRVRFLDEYIISDQTLLVRLLRNLLSNAMRYTNDGGILLAFRRQQDSVSIEVWDTGIGIKRADQKDIYREFFQVANAARAQGEGLGLGLSICYKIAALLKLELEMSSVFGKGTVFRIRLPLVTESNIAPCVEHLNVVDVQDTSVLRGLSVLIIDDDLLGLGTMSEALSSLGINTVLAQTPRRAKELANEHNGIDMILSDYRLGEEGTGVDLIHDIRQLPGMRNVPALIITGDTAPAVLQKIEASGIACIHKPASTHALATQLSMLVISNSMSAKKTTINESQKNIPEPEETL